ncbi:hypothetical protein CASFOL_019010 [Castilleja foliolosa]|uniref:Exocyst subunit Exo70 family protein n=1 Tax=Castilleja foliolosa TaxID=1961234 RepID=A0ABD3D366_9LAMI
MSDTQTEARPSEAMLSIFAELENSIKADSVKTPVPGGGVHHLTRHIMDTLEQAFKDEAHSATGSDSDFNNNSQAQVHHDDDEAVKQSPLQAQMSKVMDLLDQNLESKSKLYKDHAQSLIFLMNNGRYILQKVKGSGEIITLMGDSWCRHRSSDLRQYHKEYQRETWGRLLNCLNPDGLTINGKIAKPVVKERFKSFNTMFDEIHKTQGHWVVSDEQLQSELRISISNMIIPAYRSFLGRFSQVFSPGRQMGKYVKYQTEDIETYIDELFDGSAAHAGRKKSMKKNNNAEKS